MKNNLIIDVGMHTGRDTEFYLKKGFDVVAIEANPQLVEHAQSYFKDDLTRGSLVICDIAIANHEGEIEFYINDNKDDWGTISPEIAFRKEKLGTSNTLIKVKCTTFQNILIQHGIPYYLKIDIEGSDILCVKALLDFEDKPKYISFEAGLTSFKDACAELQLLWDLGYREFKMVNQSLNETVVCPSPPVEGVFVDYQFDGTCSGPFGEESPGGWATLEETISRYRRIMMEQRFFGANGKLFKTRLHKLYELVKGEKVGWYDIHAKFKNS